MPRWNDGKCWRRNLHATGVSDGNGNGISNGIGYCHGPNSGC
jgi:hypothetical protein